MRPAQTSSKICARHFAGLFARLGTTIRERQHYIGRRTRGYWEYFSSINRIHRKSRISRGLLASSSPRHCGTSDSAPRNFMIYFPSSIALCNAWIFSSGIPAPCKAIASLRCCHPAKVAPPTNAARAITYTIYPAAATGPIPRIRKNPAAPASIPQNTP